MKDDREKGAEILKKRRLAAKGITVRADGKPVDPMEDAGDLDADPNVPETQEEKQARVARRAAATSAGFRH